MIETTQTDQRRSFLDKCLKDKSGRLVIWQMPNLPILIWLVARIVAWSLHGQVQDIVKAISTGALLTWALLEIFQGVNYLRRLLGLIVLGALIMSLFKG